jgi:hypothetical protein
MSEEEIKIDIVELNGKLDRMADNLVVVRDRCEEISICVNKVKKAVYDPDQGLYARLRELEQWKAQTSRILWVITTSVIGLATATLWKVFF